MEAPKRRMSLLRNRDVRQSATILRAVPETTATDTALHPVQRDMTTQASEGTTNNSRQRRPSSRSSPSLREAEDVKSMAHNNNFIPSASTQDCPVSDLKSVFSNKSLKGAIGTYRNGRIHWRQNDRNSTQGEINDGPGAERNSRPKIQVVIPNATRDRPLPATPFFGNPSKAHLQSTLAELENAHHDVSPPSASNKITMRNSVVSPLGQLQSPIPFGHFQRSANHSVPKPRSRATKKPKNTPESSGSSTASRESDTSSIYSNHSSHTSDEAEIAPLPSKSVLLVRNQFNIQSPVTAGVFDDAVENGRHQRAPSSGPPRQYTQHPPNDQDSMFQPTCTLTRKPTLVRGSSKRNRQRRSLAMASNMSVINEAITRSPPRQLSNTLGKPSPTLSEAENDLHEELTSFSEDTTLVAPDDGAEQAWTSVTDDSPPKWDETVGRTDGLNHGDSGEVAGQPREGSVTFGSASPLPNVPRKSSKRQAAASSNGSRPHIPRNHIAFQMIGGHSRTKSSGLKLTIPECMRVAEEIVLSPTEMSPQVAKRTITPASAEAVILTILRSLDHLEDLFAAAVLNRGFYRVFKRHELELIKSTLRQMSPPAWEFREIAFPGHDLLHAEDLEMTRPEEEYTPAAYLMLQKRDILTIRAIKSQIRERCQSFLRPEISAALISECAIESARVDDALWRIWTFCKIFGSGKGREEDIVAQMDWLKGGPLVHQKACTFSIMSSDYVSDSLIGAPDCFAKGNEDGLTAEQLFDMMELWNCLGVLLQGFEGRTAQARKAGIYDPTDIRGGDIDGEELLLDEWCYHLLTFGLSTIIELAEPSRHRDYSAFQLAQQGGWTNWKPPVFGGTRRNFLKEAASRVYEDKIAHTYAPVSSRNIQRQQSKLRIQKHISELRHRKKNGEHTPMIGMFQERPMSEWDTVIGNLTRPPPAPASPNDIVSHIPTLRSALAQELSASIAELPAARTPPPPSTRSEAPRRTVAQPLLPTPPPSTVPSIRDRSSMSMSMPAIEEHPSYQHIPAVSSCPAHPAFTMVVSAPPTSDTHRHTRQSSDTSMHSQGSNRSIAFQQHQTQQNIFGSESYENTADKAIYRVVEMGFTADQAREALRMTDLGDGLRVDRAVELLLSRMT